MKAKFKVNQLAAKPLDMQLVHPVHGDTGIVIQLVGPHSKQFRDAMDVFKDTPGTEEDFLNLVAKSVVSWDEEAFEMPCTFENVVKFLREPENEWITAQVIPKTQDTIAFFQ